MEVQVQLQPVIAAALDNHQHYSPEQAAQIIGISLNRFNKLVSENAIAVRRIGTRNFVTGEALASAYFGLFSRSSHGRA